jgi:hypothetical protein
MEVKEKTRLWKKKRNVIAKVLCVYSFEGTSKAPITGPRNFKKNSVGLLLDDAMVRRERALQVKKKKKMKAY